MSSASESEPHRTLNFPWSIRQTRQAELRAADNRVDTGVRLAIQDVRRVEAPVEAHALGKLKRPRNARVEGELRGTDDRVAACIPPLSAGRRDIRRRIQVVARRRIERRA